MVHGIDDTPVTTFLTTGIGTGIPVLVVPAMHNTMYDHIGVQKNIEVAKEMGISFIQPVMEEKKAKMASIQQITEEVIRKLSGEKLKGKKVLIIAGATIEPIDDMRFISNRATGRTGIHLANEAFRNGGDVVLLAGSNMVNIPDHLVTDRYTSTKDLIGKITLLTNEHGSFDIAIFVAGISDYAPEPVEGKITSGQKEINLRLSRTEKVIEKYKKLYPESFLVGFKAESTDSEKELIRRGFKRLSDVGMDMIVANDLNRVTDEDNKIMMILRDKQVFKAEGKKEQIAHFIIEKCIELSGELE
jgi:phosphopantothenoylcysteine decarboxylase/phosphopantothenate--cysteine ligase